jgi:hypothetical protein
VSFIGLTSFHDWELVHFFHGVSAKPRIDWPLAPDDLPRLAMAANVPEKSLVLLISFPLLRRPARTLRPSEYSRSVIVWKLCALMKDTDVTGTPELALEGTHLDMRHDASKPLPALSYRPQNHLGISP